MASASTGDSATGAETVGSGDHVTILDATEVEDSDWEEEGEEEELLPTVQARGAAGPRGGKRKR